MLILVVKQPQQWVTRRYSFLIKLHSRVSQILRAHLINLNLTYLASFLSPVVTFQFFLNGIEMGIQPGFGLYLWSRGNWVQHRVRLGCSDMIKCELNGLSRFTSEIGFSVCREVETDYSSLKCERLVCTIKISPTVYNYSYLDWTWNLVCGPYCEKYLKAANVEIGLRVGLVFVLG